MEDITDQESLEQEDTQKGKYLTFALSNELYGIEIKHVTEIIGIQQIVQVPELPVHFKGIINLRGKIIPVMDVRLRFNKEYIDYNDRTCVIVIEIRDISMGLIVDSVSEVLSIPASEIVPPPAISKAGNRYINGIGKVGNEVKLLLNCDKLLYDDEVDNIMNVL